MNFVFRISQVNFVFRVSFVYITHRHLDNHKEVVIVRKITFNIYPDTFGGNVLHTTTCGVPTTWYFNPVALINPSRASLKRAMTSSFGSICFGSLLVALLHASIAWNKH
eukprot:19723_1